MARKPLLYFKAKTKILHDEKIQDLTAREFMVFFKFLALVGYENFGGGNLPKCDEFIAKSVRCRVDFWKKCAQIYKICGWLEGESGKYRVLDWDSGSDSSTERTRRYRERQKEEMKQCDGHGDAVEKRIEEKKRKEEPTVFFERTKDAIYQLAQNSEQMQTELLSLDVGAKIENWVKLLSDPKRKIVGHWVDPWPFISFHVHGYIWRYSANPEFCSMSHLSNIITKVPPIKCGIYGDKEYVNGRSFDWWQSTFAPAKVDKRPGNSVSRYKESV